MNFTIISTFTKHLEVWTVFNNIKVFRHDDTMVVAYVLKKKYFLDMLNIVEWNGKNV